MTVTGRRSADGGVGWGDGAAGVAVSLLPHSAQNLDRALFVAPHAGHVTVIAAPHSGQKRTPSGMVAWQDPHSIPQVYRVNRRRQRSW